MSNQAPRLSSQDLSFLEHTSSGAPMNVGGFVRLRRDDPLTIDRVRRVLEGRLAILPRLRQRAVVDENGVAWRDDPSFRIDRHVSRLPFTADDPDLSVHVSRLHADALDSTHPLWQVDLVPQGATGGAALFFRASHALVDGISSMHVLRSLFDRSSPHPQNLETNTSTSNSGTDPDSGVDQFDATDVVQDLWSTLRPRSPALLDPDQYERALAMLDGWISMIDTGTKTSRSLWATGPVMTHVVLTELTRLDMRQVRRRLGVRFDALGLAMVGGAVNRLLQARGEVESTRRIRTLVPVALTNAGRRSGLGNRASFLLVALPVGPMSPLSRLELTSDAIDEALESGQHRAATMSMRALETAAAESVAAVQAFSHTGHFVDLVVSAIPGPRRALYFDGIPHDVTFPILPITPQMRVAVGMVDIAGRLGVAITADRNALPEIDFFVEAMLRSGADIAAAADS